MNQDRMERRHDVPMPKDSQPDNKRARIEKANGQTPITDESVKNKNKTSKKQSTKHNDV